MGFEGSDDAYVYKISDSLAMIGTVDFFTPVVDDPFLFGRIAAANALSDVYAMGGEPKMAMNLLAVPDCLDPAVVAEVLRGGQSMADEAGCTIAGGHTVRNKEPLYGLSVTGFVHPGKIWKNGGACPGDALILTKPLGTGVLTTALKAELTGPEEEEALYASMAALNKPAAEVLKHYTVHACTDITGFGLAGHAREMAEGSGCSLVIEAGKLPLLPGVYGFAETGILPAGVYRNRGFALKDCEISASVPDVLQDIVFDPQTSGGLLAAVPFEEAEACLKELQESVPGAAIVGRAVDKREKEIVLV